MAVRAIAGAALLCFLGTFACGQTTPLTGGYTEKEYAGMLTCVGLTDTAWTNAIHKLEGVSIEDAKKHYDGKLEGKDKAPVLTVIDKVYADSFTSSWDYAVSFFNDCALNLASVPNKRAEFGAYCMQNAMIGLTAWSYKDGGLPAEQAYKNFEKFKADTPKFIIDRVYAGSKTRPEVGLDEWKSCMAPLRAKEVSPPAAASAKVESTTPMKVVYSEKETSSLMSCVIMAEHVWFTAEQKLNGVSLRDVKKKYERQATDENKKATELQIVDQVYSNRFTDSWTYSLGFFGRCAQKLANIPQDRVALANSCAGNALIGTTAQSSKNIGVPAQKVHERFAYLGGVSGSSVIDRVYASSGPSGNAGLEEWKTCVGAPAPGLASPPAIPAATTNIVRFVPFADAKVQGLPIARSDVLAPYFLGSQEEQKKIVDAFVADNSKADSVALYVAANTAIKIGDVKDAGFLLYAAQIRKHFDYKRYGLSETNRREIQAYWDFLNRPIGEDVNPAITRRPKEFSDVVDMIVKWQVVPAEDALYDAKLYGAQVLAREQWQAEGDAEKKDFLDNFANKEKAFLSNSQNVEALSFVQDYNFGKIPHTPENEEKYKTFQALIEKTLSP